MEEIKRPHVVVTPSTLVFSLTPEHLDATLASFRERQRQVLQLRSRVNRLLHGVDDELWCSTYQ